MKSINFYRSKNDVGNHENYLKKVGEFHSSNKVYRVTFVSDNSAIVIYNNEIKKLEAGMIIGVNAIIKTNFSNVEIKTQDDDTFRLGNHSEFCLEYTVEGLQPVHYGNIYFLKGGRDTQQGGGKYRTSCWTDRKTNSILTERINDYSDIYYALDSPVEIYEYDEKGIKFSIVKIEPFQKCILEFNFEKCMRERYSVSLIEDLETNEIKNIYDNYVLPLNWNEKYISKKSNTFNNKKSEII